MYFVHEIAEEPHGSSQRKNYMYVCIKPIITVWAAEKGSLVNGHHEFSFGNGNSGSEHAYGGYCMSAPGRIIR